MTFLTLAATMATGCRWLSNLQTDANEIAKSILCLYFQPRAVGFVLNTAHFSPATSLTLLMLFSSNHPLYSEFIGSSKFNVVGTLILNESTTVFSNPFVYIVSSTLSMSGSPCWFTYFICLLVTVFFPCQISFAFPPIPQLVCRCFVAYKDY